MSKAIENYHRKRKLIIHAARELFANNGFAETSMDGVALSAGVSKQTVYRYFPSKTELFTATLELCAEQPPAKHRFGNQDIDRELFDFAMHFMRFHVSPDYLNTIRLLMAEGRREKGLGAAFYNNGPKKSGAMLSEFLQKKIPGIRDADRLSFLFVSMLLNVRMPLLLGLKKDIPEQELEAHARLAVETFLNGCRKNDKHP